MNNTACTEAMGLFLESALSSLQVSCRSWIAGPGGSQNDTPNISFLTRVSRVVGALAGRAFIGGYRSQGKIRQNLFRKGDWHAFKAACRVHHLMIAPIFHSAQPQSKQLMTETSPWLRDHQLVSTGTKERKRRKTPIFIRLQSGQLSFLLLSQIARDKDPPTPQTSSSPPTSSSIKPWSPWKPKFNCKFRT